MSDSSTVFPHTMEFHNKKLLLIDHSGAPFVPVNPILEGLGLRRDGRIANQAIDQFKTHLITLCTPSPEVKNGFMECLPLRKISAWLMALDRPTMGVSTRKKLTVYQNGCDDTLWAKWTELRESSRTAAYLTYQGRPFRFLIIGDECWYVASDVVAALGLRNTKALLSTLPSGMQVTQRVGDRRFVTINQSGFEHACLNAPPCLTECLRMWLASVSGRTEQTERKHFANDRLIRRQSADMVLDFLTRSRTAMREAGIGPVDWDEGRAQQIAENLPWLLIRDRRWLFTVSDSGVPLFSVVPSNAGVFTPEAVVSWVRESDGANMEILPLLLLAIGERLKTIKIFKT